MNIIVPTHLLPWWLKSPAQRQAEAELREAAIALRDVVARMQKSLAGDAPRPPPGSLLYR